MKKPILMLLVAVAALFAAPAAEAGSGHSRKYVSFHRSCEGPAWVETYVVGHTRWGRPILRTRVVPVRRHVHVRRHAPYCPPPVYHGHGHGHRHHRR